jgi:hypothetical protein
MAKDPKKKTPTGQRAQAVTQAAEAAGIKINLSQFGSKISKAELDQVNQQLIAAKVNPVDFTRTQAGQTGYVYESGLQPRKEPGTEEDPGIAYQKSKDEAERKSAFQILEDTFRGYGLEDLASQVRQYMIEGIDYAQGTIRLRQSDVYKTRFAGNQGRIAKGLAAYDPREYLQAEEEYKNLLASAGLGDLSTKENFASLIGGAVSLAEAQDRIKNVFNRIDNAPAELKAQLGRYFGAYGVNDPGIQRSQLAKSLLLGDTSSQTLERNLQKAQLFTGAVRSGLELPEERIQNLQQQLESQGVSDFLGKGMTGFQDLSESLQETSRLGSFYGRLAKPEEQELEQEAFFGLKSQRRKKLQETEKAAFAGRAGTGTQSLARDIAGGI